MAAASRTQGAKSAAAPAVVVPRIKSIIIVLQGTARIRGLWCNTATVGKLGLCTTH